MGEPRVTHWAVWYGDGAVERGVNPAELNGRPEEDVQAVVLYHDDDRRTIIHGEDDYRVAGSPWTGEGRWMKPDEAYFALIERALSE